MGSCELNPPLDTVSTPHNPKVVNFEYAGDKVTNKNNFKMDKMKTDDPNIICKTLNRSVGSMDVTEESTGLSITDKGENILIQLSQMNGIQNVSDVKVFNTLGQMVYSSKTVVLPFTLSKEFINEGGVYFIFVDGAGGQHYKKVLITK